MLRVARKKSRINLQIIGDVVIRLISKIKIRIAKKNFNSILTAIIFELGESNMNTNFYGILKKEEETDFEFCLRCCLAKHNKEIDIDWCDIVDAFPLLNNCHYDTLRKNFSGKMGVGEVVKFYEEKIIEISKQKDSSKVHDVFLDELEEKRIELQKERIKLQDQRREYSKLVRTEARWETFVETMESAIASLDKFDFDTNNVYKIEGQGSIASLMISDIHLGMKIESFANVYNMEIAQLRLKDLAQQVISRCKIENVETLNVEILGDLLHGIIHLGTRVAQEEDVIVQTTTCAEMLTSFVEKLSQHIPNVIVRFAVGNHSRISANIKESISSENFEYLILWHMKSRLKDSPNISFGENYLDKEIAIYEVFGKTIVSCHGHREKKVFNSIDKLSNYLKINVDEVHAGHFHNFAIQNNVFINPSFCGVDQYAMECRYNSEPSQLMRVYYPNGNSCTYQFMLNNEL